MDKIQVFAQSIEILRQFFMERDIKEVLTPPAVLNPGIEPHLHPFQLYSPHRNEHEQIYLHTSPEFWMKWILANSTKLTSAYTLSYCFRDEPKSEWHRNQFLMLEWYRKNESYQKIMQDCEELLLFFQESPLKSRISLTNNNTLQLTVKDTFQEFLGTDLNEILTLDEIKNYINKDHQDLSGINEITEWEDAFFLLFLNKVEPKFKNIPSLILKEFPIQLAALSEASKEDPRYCQRFEWYIKGVEIANCFQELTDLKIQKERAKQDLEKKEKLYGYSYDQPHVLFNALETGLPQSTGIALGFERLLKVLIKDYDFQFI